MGAVERHIAMAEPTPYHGYHAAALFIQVKQFLKCFVMKRNNWSVECSVDSFIE